MTHNEKRQSWAKEGMIGLGGRYETIILKIFSVLYKNA